jgi:hypothetical protein
MPGSPDLEPQQSTRESQAATEWLTKYNSAWQAVTNCPTFPGTLLNPLRNLHTETGTQTSTNHAK